jgi:hypothetical protein
MNQIVRIDADSLLDLICDVRKMHESLTSVQDRCNQLLTECRAMRDWLHLNGYGDDHYQLIVNLYKDKTR